MSPIRQEVQSYINLLPDAQLEVIKSLLALLITNEPLTVETDLTDEEKQWVREGREEYAKGNYVPLQDVLGA